MTHGTGPLGKGAKTQGDKRVDMRLLVWARSTARREGRGGQIGAKRHIPPLWLFTDTIRLPDPRPAVRRLPQGLAGVVFRHDDHPDRAALAQDVQRICRQRRLVLVIAGDPRLAASLHAGMHLRGGRRSGRIAAQGFVTSSAHDAADLRRAARAGADLVFLSPAFPTASHPGAPALGVVRWSGLARRAGIAVAALGGIDGATVRRLPPRSCRGIGAIGALA